MTSNKVILKGKQSDLKPIISQLLALHQILDERDIGSWVGYPVYEWYRKAPQSHVSVKIILSTFKEPPFFQVGEKWFSKRQVTIPVVDESRLTYDAIRAACGGSTGQNWGEYKARALLGFDADNQVLYRLVVGGSTESSAVRNLERFLPLTKLVVKGLTIGKEDYTKGYRARLPQREKYNSFDVFPAKITITNTKVIDYLDAASPGKPTSEGRQQLKKICLPIYQDAEPDEWQSKLRNVLRKDFEVRL